MRNKTRMLLLPFPFKVVVESLTVRQEDGIKGIRMKKK